MARALFENWRTGHRGTPIRLLGMGVSGLEPANAAEQSAGDRRDSRAERDIDQVFDEINRRYGDAGVVHGQVLRRKRR